MRYGISKYKAVTHSGVSSGHAVGPNPRKTVKPPSIYRPVQQHGIKISIGPHGGKHIRNWYTFPVTPESIPVATGATWNSRYTLRGGELVSFGGKNLDVVAFSGRLEPPEFYTQQGFTNANGVVAQSIDEDLLATLQNQAHISGEEFSFNGDNVAVVMQHGAYAGPNFLEAQAFVDLLEAAEKDGEVMRLIVGDNFGFNKPVFIESFVWKFEDPDPDVLLYEISFKEHREQKPTTAKTGHKKRDRPKDSTYVTHKGDTLHSIAVHEWGDGGKWRSILNLNRKVIASLWWYPDDASEGKKDWRQKGSIGPKIPAKFDGFQISSRVSDNAGDWIPPDLPFRADVKLRIEAPEMGISRHVRVGNKQHNSKAN